MFGEVKLGGNLEYVEYELSIKLPLRNKNLEKSKQDHMEQESLSIDLSG